MPESAIEEIAPDKELSNLDKAASFIALFRARNGSEYFERAEPTRSTASGVGDDLGG